MRRTVKVYCTESLPRAVNPFGRHGHWTLPILFGGLLSLSLAACGGSSSGPPPNPLYVRSSGQDTNSGATPDQALQTITRAAQLALDNYAIVVGAGTYDKRVTTDKSNAPAAQGVVFIADTSGELTGDAGPVVIDLGGSGSEGFKLNNSPGTIIDGFTVTGSPGGGIVINSSDGVRVQNCVVFRNQGSQGDGIRVLDSANVLLFNNVVYKNSNTGINIAGQLTGSPNANVVSNTIFSNSVRGISIGNTSAASPAAFVRNNIVQSNGTGIKVFLTPRSDLDYSGNFNLVFPESYDPTTLKGTDDVADSAAFLDPNDQVAPDFRLRSTSPALDAGGSVDGSLTNCLRKWSTTTDNAPDDDGALDLGWHNPITDPHCGVPLPPDTSSP